MVSYYRLLGVATDAAPAEIKRAYHGLARKFHPDHNDGHPMSQERFRQIAEAYEVLGDSRLRRDYDRYGAAGLRGLARPGVTSGLERFVSDLEAAIEARIRRFPRRGKDLRTVATITLEQACLGGTITIELTRRGECGVCRGSRAQPGTSTESCHVCSGAGSWRSRGVLGSVEPCLFCQGTGQIALSPCTGCDGLGEHDVRTPLVVDVPAGVEEGRRLVLRGHGERGHAGGGPGDLYIELQVAAHPLLRRDGADIHCDLPLTLGQAVLGAHVDVPLLSGGTTTVRVKPGARSGNVLRLRGRGAPREGGRAGDLFLHLVLDTPELPADGAREALRQLEDLCRYPRHEAYRSEIAAREGRA